MKKALLNLFLIAIFGFGQAQIQYTNTTIEVHANIDEQPFSITISWSKGGHTGYEIYRKFPEQTNWDSVYATVESTVRSFTDTDVEEGVIYEYGVKGLGTPEAFGYILTGQNLAASEHPGTVILLVDSTFTTSLASEIAVLETDLRSAGWKIERDDITRTTSNTYVKSVIQNIYDADPDNVNTVFILGHVPWVTSGWMAPDGHEGRPWGTTQYYGDVIDGNQWTDDNNTGNYVAGDGIFDENNFPGTDNFMDIAVGRVDFVGMTSFSESEEELLRRYLKKNHEFRHKIINPPMRALIEDNFGPTYGEYFGSTGYRNFYNLIGRDNVDVIDFDNLRTEKYMFSFGCGPGSHGSCGDVVTSSAYASNSYFSVFNVLFGSYFGQWDHENNLMRSSMASNGYTLVSFWSGRPYLHFHQIGMGWTIGEALRMAQNNRYAGPYTYNTGAGGIHPSLMGDPTLHMYIVAPVADISATVDQGDITLHWQGSSDVVDGYYIYRDTTGSGDFKKISGLVTGNSFTDTEATTGDNYYMIRAYDNIKSRTGNFFAYSHGIYDTVDADVNTSEVLVTGIDLEAEGGTAAIFVNDETVKIIANVSPANATIPYLKWTTNNTSGVATVSDNGVVYPLGNGTITIYAESTDGTNIIDSIDVIITNQVNHVEDIIISRANGDTTVSINEGPVQLYAEVIPQYADNTEVYWAVLNGTGKATIDDNGKITGTQLGTVTVAAVSTDGTNLQVEKEFLITDDPAPVSIQEIKLSPRIYPNPANQVVTIANIQTGCKVDILNLAGQIIETQVASSNHLKMDISQQASGVYFIRISLNNERVTKKLIKQ